MPNPQRVPMLTTTLERLRRDPRFAPSVYYLLARQAFSSDAELARTLGVPAATVDQWKVGVLRSPADERLLRHFAMAVSELLAVYEPEAIPDWLAGRSPGELKTPAEWLREGNVAEVLNLINASTTGAYS